MKGTVVVDFDGVIHEYSSPWTDAATVSDGLVPGAREAVAELRRRFFVVVVSSRCCQASGREAVERWLKDRGVEVDAVQSEKPAACALTIDDRALRFEGDWAAALAAVDGAMVPWNRKK